MTRTRRDRERGSMGVEVVIWVPILVGVMMLVVAFGRYVDMRGNVEAIARDAARSASYARSFDAAHDAARQTAGATAPSNANCRPADLSGSDFRAGGHVQVTITCDISYSGLGLVGLPGSVTMTGESAAPLDTYRRTG